MTAEGPGGERVFYLSLLCLRLGRADAGGRLGPTAFPPSTWPSIRREACSRQRSSRSTKADRAKARSGCSRLAPRACSQRCLARRSTCLCLEPRRIRHRSWIHSHRASLGRLRRNVGELLRWFIGHARSTRDMEVLSGRGPLVLSPDGTLLAVPITNRSFVRVLSIAPSGAPVLPGVGIAVLHVVRIRKLRLQLRRTARGQSRDPSSLHPLVWRGQPARQELARRARR